MKIKVLVGLLIFLIVLNLATLGSYVYYRWFKPPQFVRLPRTTSKNKLEMKIGLDKTQRQKFLELRREFRERAMPYFREIREIQQEIMDLFISNRADEDTIREKYKRMIKLRNKIEELSIEMLLDTRKFLTPLQTTFLYRYMNNFSVEKYHQNLKLNKQSRRNN